MLALMGECLGTFILLFFGLGSGLGEKIQQSGVSYFVIGLRWGGAIYTANLIGLLFGSHNLNPVFSLVSLLEGQQTWLFFLLEVSSQAVGAALAMITLISLYYQSLSQSQNGLELLAAVPSSKKTSLNVYAEFLGTFLLVLFSKTVLYLNGDNPFTIGLISLALSFLIMVIAPITGASFNPIRDFIPRLFYGSFLNKRQVKVWEQAWITVLIPIAGGLLASVVSRMF